MNFPPYQDPPLPGTDPSEDDLAAFEQPQPEFIAEQPTVPSVPERQPEGLSFDWSMLAYDTREEFDAKPEPLKRLIRDMHPTQGLGIQYSQEQAAKKLLEYQEQLRQQSSPKTQAELAAKQAEITAKQAELAEADKAAKEDAQRTYQRASNMVWLLDNLRGGKRGEVPVNNEKWRPRVGSVDGRWPSILSSEETLGWNADFASLKGMINLEEAQRNRGQGSLTDGERVLMAQAASLGLEQARDEKGFQAAFERMYDMAVETQQANMKKLSGADKVDSSQAQPNAGATPLPPPQFKSREEVVQAVNTGQLSREQAAAILRNQFSNEFR